MILRALNTAHNKTICPARTIWIGVCICRRVSGPTSSIYAYTNTHHKNLREKKHRQKVTKCIVVKAHRTSLASLWSCIGYKPTIYFTLCLSIHLREFMSFLLQISFIFEKKGREKKPIRLCCGYDSATVICAYFFYWKIQMINFHFFFRFIFLFSKEL